MGEHPQVAVIVCNWNDHNETLACLELLSRSDWPNLTTIVVDNGSDLEVEPMVAGRFPDVHVVRNPTNRGFAGGMTRDVDFNHRASQARERARRARRKM